MRTTVISLMQNLKSRLYGGPLKAAIRELRLQGPLRSLYETLFDTLRPSADNPQYSPTVGSVEAAFDTPYQDQYGMVKRTVESERPVLSDLLSNLRQDDVLYDVGAHIGVFSCFAAKITDSVIAFEPRDGIADHLQRNADLNGSHVDVYRLALSSTRTEGMVDDKSIVESPLDGAGINMVPGDALVEERELPVPSAVKIDVEGAEYDVIKGLERTLARPECRMVYCEIHLPKPDDGEVPSIYDYGETPEGVHSLLESLGFTTEVIHRRERDYHLKAWKESSEDA